MRDEKVIENLKKYNQTRTLKILENVDETIKNKIIEQLKDINFTQLKELYNNIKKEAEVNVGELKPIKSLNPDKISKKLLGHTQINMTEYYQNDDDELVLECISGIDFKIQK